MIFFFFFSSRRRHTRCSRDWSSDVCSSDLIHRESANPCSRLPRWKPLRQSHGPAKCRRRLPARSPPPRASAIARPHSTRSRPCRSPYFVGRHPRSEEHTSELQSRLHLVCRLLLEKKRTL